MIDPFKLDMEKLREKWEKMLRGEEEGAEGGADGKDGVEAADKTRRAKVGASLLDFAPRLSSRLAKGEVTNEVDLFEDLSAIPPFGCCARPVSPLNARDLRDLDEAIERNLWVKERMYKQTIAENKENVDGNGNNGTNKKSSGGGGGGGSSDEENTKLDPNFVAEWEVYPDFHRPLNYRTGSKGSATASGTILSSSVPGTADSTSSPSGGSPEGGKKPGRSKSKLGGPKPQWPKPIPIPYQPKGIPEMKELLYEQRVNAKNFEAEQAGSLRVFNFSIQTVN